MKKQLYSISMHQKLFLLLVPLRELTLLRPKVLISFSKKLFLEFSRCDPEALGLSDLPYSVGPQIVNRDTAVKDRDLLGKRFAKKCNGYRRTA